MRAESAMWWGLGLGAALSSCSPEHASTPADVVELPAIPVASKPTGSAPTGEQSPPEWTGAYRQAHDVSHVCDSPDWCVDEVEDSLVITARGELLAARVELVQTNFHTCTWEGELRRRDGRTWESMQPECSVVLTLEDGSLKLTSEGCREHCGARAYLSSTFPLSSRSLAPTPP